LKKYDFALKCFDKVLELNPDDKDAKKRKEEILSSQS